MLTQNLIKFSPLKVTHVGQTIKINQKQSHLTTIGRYAVAIVFAARSLNELMAFLVNKQFTLYAFEALLAQTPNSIMTKCAKCFLNTGNAKEERKKESKLAEY